MMYFEWKITIFYVDEIKVAHSYFLFLSVIIFDVHVKFDSGLVNSRKNRLRSIWFNIRKSFEKYRLRTISLNASESFTKYIIKKLFANDLNRGESIYEIFHSKWVTREWFHQVCVNHLQNFRLQNAVRERFESIWWIHTISDPLSMGE